MGILGKFAGTVKEILHNYVSLRTDDIGDKFNLHLTPRHC